MADREIHCTRCRTYLGTIRDAKLKKGMTHLCGNCDTAFKAVEMMHKNKTNDSPFGDMFGDIFKK